MVNADYVWITGDAFTDMRLLIEGAIDHWMGFRSLWEELHCHDVTS